MVVRLVVMNEDESWRDHKALMNQEETGEVADKWVRKLIPETSWCISATVISSKGDNFIDEERVLWGVG